MLCPRCKAPVAVDDTTLLWSCTECGYDHKQFCEDLEAQRGDDVGLVDTGSEEDST
jgi:ribosomal protein L37AE/L43A